MVTRGRPRDIPREIEVLTLLSRRLPVGEIAKRTGLHRNSVGNIRSRVTAAGGDVLHELKELEEELRELDEQEAEIKCQQAAARKAQEAARYKAAVTRLFAMIDELVKEARKLTRCVGARRSLDFEFTNGGSFHEIVEGESASAEDEASSNEVNAILSEAIDGLTELQQKIIRLAFWDNETEKSIAAKLGHDAKQVAEIRQAGMELLRESREVGSLSAAL